jgi:hypothetical protein
MFTMAREGSSGRRHAVLVLVIVVHAALVALALRQHAGIELQNESDTSPLILLLTAPATPPSTVAPPAHDEKRRAAASAKQARPASGDFAITLDTQTAPSSDALPLRLGVDWDQQTAAVANSQADSIFKELKRVCEEAARRPAFRSVGQALHSRAGILWLRRRQTSRAGRPCARRHARP